MYFSQKSSASEIKQGYRFNRENVVIDNFQEIENKIANIKLNVEETEISKTLKEKFKKLPINQQNLLGHSTPVNVTSFFRNNNITSHKDIPQDEAFLELFANYTEHSSELLEFLKDALNIKITKNKFDPKASILRKLFVISFMWYRVYSH